MTAESVAALNPSRVRLDAEGADRLIFGRAPGSQTGGILANARGEWEGMCFLAGSVDSSPGWAIFSEGASVATDCALEVMESASLLSLKGFSLCEGRGEDASSGFVAA